VRFQVFTAVFLKIKVIRDVMLTELAFWTISLAKDRLLYTKGEDTMIRQSISNWLPADIV
jgi:hypothetical protein